jgi:hypothetical protein
MGDQSEGRNKINYLTSPQLFPVMLHLLHRPELRSFWIKEQRTAEEDDDDDEQQEEGSSSLGLGLGLPV